jgi:hypothetical protein
MTYSYIALLFCCLLLQVTRDISETDKNKHEAGVFYGNLSFTPIGDGVHMKILQLYSYRDFYGHILSAQPGFITDGASIPRALWSIVGSPFTGKYLGAAVVHDVGCDSHKYSWQVTHKIFYDAMLDSGVGNNLAKLLYYGVRLGGPRWKTISISAATEAELSRKIAESGAISIIESAGTTNSERPMAVVIVSTKANTITEQQISDFDTELKKRELENNPISVTEIDDRTE